jgi:DNA (cytosine-5)-methyltransferase 1
MLSLRLKNEEAGDDVLDSGKKYIDLFAGCGGLSLGLHNAGWKGLFAIEKNTDAFETLEYNLIKNKNHFDWPEWLPKGPNNINTIIKKYEEKLKGLQGKVSLVVGGPPCQGFSMAGMRNDKDNRNKLINSYVKFISLVMPDLIFFENVRGFTLNFMSNRSKGKKYSEKVIKILNEIGYNVHGELINFGEYGIPQKRTRFILVGIRKNINGSSIEKAKSFFTLLENNKFNFLSNKNIKAEPTIEEAISDLLKSIGTTDTPDRKGYQSGLYSTVSSKYQEYMRKGIISSIPNSHSFPKHRDKTIERLENIISMKIDGKNLSREIKQRLKIKKQFLVPLSANNQSPTITSNPDDLIHYCEPRFLTVREYARLQSFPDWYEFKGRYTTGGKKRKVEVPRYSQIGNAIPPLFGEQSGIILGELLKNERCTEF